MDLANLHSLNYQFMALLGGFFVFSLFILSLSLLIKILVKLGLIHLKKPPLVVATSLILFLGYIGFIRNVIFSPNFTVLASLFGLIYPLVGMFFIVGIWKMKKWGIIGLAILISLFQVFNVLSGAWVLLSLVYFVPLLFVSKYFAKMA